MRWIVIGAVLAVGLVERAAEPVTLPCDGKMYAARFGQEVVIEDYSLALTVDLPARTVTVGSYGTVPISWETSRNTVVFMAKPDSRYGVSSGTLNRITGAVLVHIITLTDGLYTFYGTCKLARRLF